MRLGIIPMVADWYTIIRPLCGQDSDKHLVDIFPCMTLYCRLG